MRRRIKTKIIASAAIIVTLALITSGVIAYDYFFEVLKKQVMHDEAIKVSQTAGQLRYVQDDIRQLAQYILVDSEIQSRIHAIYASDTYERLSAEEWLRTKLNRYLLLKNWIESIVLVDKNGQAVSTSSSSNAYYAETLKEDWYVHHLARNVHSGFSEVHDLARGTETVPVISYIIRFNPLLDPSSHLNRLIIHVNANYVLNVLPGEGLGYDSYYLLGAQNRVLFGAGAGIDLSSIQAPLERLAANANYQGEDAARIFTINREMSDGWKLLTVKPTRAVRSDINSVLYIYVIVTVVTLVVIMAALTPLILNITRPISKLTNAMKEASIGRLHTTVSIRSGDEIELLGEGFNRMLHELQAYVGQSVEDEKIKQKLRFDLLLSQINPHFIYNTLNTIIYMAQRDGNADIVRMTESFIRLLQSAVLVEEASGRCSVAEEIESVKHYLVIQSYRYPERFEVRWEVANGVAASVIPRTILQPLIENALFHGIMPKPETGMITVRIKEDGVYLRIEVEDDGIGMDARLLEQFERGESVPAGSSQMRPIGLGNVRDRIRALGGSAADLTIIRLPAGGTRIQIRLPMSMTAGSYTK